MSQIVLVKLISGEEMIATKSNDVYSKAKVFSVGQDNTGKPTVGLVPFIMVHPDWSGHLNSALILVETPAPADVAKSYIQTTTVIQLL